MICGGDEIGRTQRGNNNAYAQDNEISWFDWSMDDRKKALLEFTRRLVALRREHPNLHRRKFFQDRGIDPATPQRHVNGREEKDITWLRPDGGEMTSEEWNAGWVRCIGFHLNGRTLDDVNTVGEPVRDEGFLILLNPHTETIRFFMPPLPGVAWELVLDSAAPGRTDRVVIPSGEPFDLIARSTALLRELTD
jgi:glycogen operon protein